MRRRTQAEMDELVRSVGLEKQGMLRERRQKWYLAPSIAYPAQAINIRSSSGENFAVVDTSCGSLLETVEASVAFFQVHPGAIYLHQGESYLITNLDLAGRTAGNPARYRPRAAGGCCHLVPRRHARRVYLPAAGHRRAVLFTRAPRRR